MEILYFKDFNDDFKKCTNLYGVIYYDEKNLNNFMPVTFLQSFH